MASQTTSGYIATVEEFRGREFPMLQDSVYLDHAGSTLCAKSLMDAFAAEITSVLYGNPHSSSWPSQLSTSRIEDTRLRLLKFFNADPAEYDLVFVANATAGVKLVVEGMRSLPQGFRYAYHQACHTSLVGVREEATGSTCLANDDVQSWLNGTSPFGHQDDHHSAILFSYPAQSHLDGRRYPLGWAKKLHDRYQDAGSPIFTLLDAASLSATSPLDLSNPEFAADFVVLSLYKIFGFPDLGVLMVRRSAEAVFDRRRYFGGGTVDMAVCGKEQWHAPKSTCLHERLEDGTLPFHNIIAADIALQAHTRLFGSMARIRAHTSYLTERLHDGLAGLEHGNGQPVCVMYTELGRGSRSLGVGPVVSFNIRNSAGAWLSLAEFDKLAHLKKMHVRTGSLCSPGGIASALDLAPWEMKRNFSAGFRCGSEFDIIHGKPTGVIRASLGAMSTLQDVTKFIDFVEEFFMEQAIPINLPAVSMPDTTTTPSFRVKSITVYPIKSCGGFCVPSALPWAVRNEGLAWDREWCLVHQGSGQALSQKRFPGMALLQPSIDLGRGVLHVNYRGQRPQGSKGSIDIPLSADPTPFDGDFRDTQSRVCGDKISALVYTSEAINDFFTDVLGIPCSLARFPPGGRGMTSRLAKARMQRHQQAPSLCTLPGSFPDVPSPPDSDPEQQSEDKILLSNESPILMINSSSVDALNAQIQDAGGVAVSETAFRGNIVIESTLSSDVSIAFAEDFWLDITIGRQYFKLLGACQRCQMLCIDQETGEKKQEPFATLAKTRRFNGKVYFGAHMRHDPPSTSLNSDDQFPVIQVGQAVSIRTRR
ncbi:hypothetical protein S40293_03714 [Stachybotrys chartarum IBT 40293]|nr:hypothetical protein S40293_03714 [Stachybotrys chartarum IBT 40293]